MKANIQPFRFDDPQAVDNVRHHFVLFLVDEIVILRNALIWQSRFAGMPKLEGFDRRDAKWATDRALKLCSDWSRLDRAFSALTWLSCGMLSAELSPIHEQITRTREKLKGVGKAASACKVDQRLSTNLADVIGPLCDDLERHVIEYYTVAKSLYNLPELDCIGTNK